MLELVNDNHFWFLVSQTVIDLKLSKLTYHVFLKVAVCHFWVSERKLVGARECLGHCSRRYYLYCNTLPHPFEKPGGFSLWLVLSEFSEAHAFELFTAETKAFSSVSGKNINYFKYFNMESCMLLSRSEISMLLCISGARASAGVNWYRCFVFSEAKPIYINWELKLQLVKHSWILDT